MNSSHPIEGPFSWKSPVVVGGSVGGTCSEALSCESSGVTHLFVFNFSVMTLLPIEAETEIHEGTMQMAHQQKQKGVSLVSVLIVKPQDCLE